MSALVVRRLRVHREEAVACRRCESVVGPAVIGPPVASRIYALGQAPGPHEAGKGRPFAHTAGRTLFRWMSTIGVDEALYRERVYMAAVARCFPGKQKGKGAKGDRVPSADEIERCRPFVAREIAILRPELVIPIGRLAIAEVLGPFDRLEDVVGSMRRTHFHGRVVDVVPLPHPSGLSAWPKVEPGTTLLARALARIAEHPTWRATFSLPSPRTPA